MATDRDFHLPEFDDAYIAIVHLLQGVVYYDDGRTWELVLVHQSRLDTYFTRLGLRLVVDQPEGFAFLRQLEESELNHGRGYEQLPKLFHKKRLSYDATLACVILREELRRFEEEDVNNTRCVVLEDELFAQWKMYFPAAQDDQRSRRALESALAVLEGMKFIREFTKEPREWEIRRILKARIPISELERLLCDLKAESHRRLQKDVVEDTRG